MPSFVFHAIVYKRKRKEHAYLQNPVKDSVSKHDAYFSASLGGYYPATKQTLLEYLFCPN